MLRLSAYKIVWVKWRVETHPGLWKRMLDEVGVPREGGSICRHFMYGMLLLKTGAVWVNAVRHPKQYENFGERGRNAPSITRCTPWLTCWFERGCYSTYASLLQFAHWHCLSLDVAWFRTWSQHRSLERTNKSRAVMQLGGRRSWTSKSYNDLHHKPWTQRHHSHLSLSLSSSSPQKAPWMLTSFALL